MNGVVSSPHPHWQRGGDPVTGSDCINLHKAAFREDWMLTCDKQGLAVLDIDSVEIIGLP